MTGEPVKHKLLDLIQQKEKMEGRRLSITEVAKGAGLNTRTVTRWLESTPKSYDAQAIAGFCKYFKCEIQDLLYLDAEAV